MLEIKCPKSRKLNGFVPEYYLAQVQGQLEVCDLEYFSAESRTPRNTTSQLTYGAQRQIKYLTGKLSTR